MLSMQSARAEFTGHMESTDTSRDQPAQIARILVVVEPDLLAADSPESSALIRRGLWLASGARATLELFHVRADRPNLAHWRHSHRERMNEHIERIDQAATTLAELAANLAAESGLAVEHDAWGAENDVAAILQKTAESRADLVLKATDRTGYRIGLIERPDWALLRQSPAHVWFVGEEVDAPRHLLAATGDSAEEDSAGIDAVDDAAICAFAAALRDACQLRTSILHASDSGREAGQQSLAELLEPLTLDPVSTNVIQGPPRDALPEFAERLNADVILMGASSLNRLARLLRRVDAEPVLEHSRGDVVFLRPADPPAPSPKNAEAIVQGLPGGDVRRALSAPGVVFDHSPDKLSAESRLSVAMRRRLLKIWEQELKASLLAEDDGGMTGGLTGAPHAKVHQSTVELSMERDPSERPHG